MTVYNETLAQLEREKIRKASSLGKKKITLTPQSSSFKYQYLIFHPKNTKCVNFINKHQCLFRRNMEFYHEILISLEAILTLPAKQTIAERHQSLGPTSNSSTRKEAGQYHQRSGPDLRSKQNRGAPRTQVSTTTLQKTYCTMEWGAECPVKLLRNSHTILSSAMFSLTLSFDS